MSNTFRTVRFPERDGGVRETKSPEVDSRWRADRDERLRRESQDAKRIERAERHTARTEDSVTWPLGSTVRSIV